MLIRRLDHVNIRTRDIPTVVAFYRDILELEERDPPSNLDRTMVRWMYDDRNDPIVHISTPGSLSEHGQDDDLTGNTGGLDHYAFQCVGIEPLRERLKQFDVPWRENRVDVIKMTQVFIHDPTGVQIELNVFDSDPSATA
jgi:catechol 2,3-dioxygenase-like lactoylglutathione lyase family enzyme